MRFTASITAALLVFVAWAGNPVSFAGDARNLTSINGSVRASPGETYDTLSAVNGDVRVAAGATVETVRTVNGEVVIESESKVGNASTVNGSLDIADGATVSGNASTVNGNVKLAQHSHVGGDVSTVSGDIELRGAEVGGGVSTSNGGIELTDSAHVRGGIHVKDSNKGWGKGHGDLVKVHICATCVVEGDLQFDREVELRVDNGAKIGKVIGDKVKRL